jgi:hypothetical protein
MMTPNTAISSDSCFHEEGDWIAQQFFSPEDLRMSPEEYVARHAHALGCFSFHFYRYRDPALGAWVRRVGESLSTEGEVERCRRRFLSVEELAAVRRRETKGL